MAFLRNSKFAFYRGAINITLLAELNLKIELRGYKYCAPNGAKTGLVLNLKI